MIIESLNITAYGKLKNMELAFSPKFNLIYGPNEAGKSTLQYFIYSSFYGAKADKLSGMPLRDYFAPWDTPVFGGSLQYRLKGGENHKIFRKFDKNKDNLELIDLATGSNIVSIYPETTGRLKESAFANLELGVSREVFKDTVFMTQAKVTQLDNKDKLSELLQASASTGTESGTSVGAVDKLNEALKEAGTERASTKELAKVREKINALEEEARQIRQERENLKDIFLKLKTLKEEKTEIQKKEEHLSGAMYISRLKFLKEKLQFLNEVANTLTETENELKGIDEKISQTQTRRNILQGKLIAAGSGAQGRNEDAGGLERIKKAEIEIENMEKEKLPLRGQAESLHGAREQYKNKNKVFLNAAYAALLIFVASFVLFFVFKSKFVLFFLFGGAAASFIVGILVFINLLEIKKYSGDINIIEDKIREIESKQAEIKNKTGGYLKSLGVSSVKELEDAFAELEKMDESSGSANALKEGVRKRAREAQASYHQQAKEIREHIAKMRIDWIDISGDLAQNISRIDEAMRQKAGELGVDLNELSDKESFMQNIVKRSNEIDNEMNLLMGMKQKALEGLRGISEVEEELDAAYARLNGLLFYIESLTEAVKELEEISVDYHKRVFAPNITSYAGQIIGKITDKYRAIFIDNNFDINVEIADDIGVKNAETLSLGAKEQLYFALKVALGKYFSLRGEVLPVILDDVFSNFDIERRGRAVEFLLDLSAEAQVIIFTSDINQFNQAKEILSGRNTPFTEDATGEFNVLRCQAPHSYT